MSRRPLVSVITATYNMSRFIDAAIESVLGQTYANLQYVIVDDGSTDDTKAKVDSYASDSRLEYYYQKNRGQTAAKNAGLKRARGNYICFLDADNVWAVDKLQKQVRTFEALPASCKILYTDQLYIDDNGAVIGRPTLETYSGKISDKLLFENFVTFNTAMIKRECVDELGGFDESLERSIDYELWLRFSTRYEFYYLPQVTAYYRIWEGQMSQDTERRFKAALHIMETFLENNPSLIDRSTIKKAWNYAFTARGRYEASRAQFVEAIKNFVKALSYDYASLYTWKSIVKMIIARSRS